MGPNHVVLGEQQSQPGGTHKLHLPEAAGPLYRCNDTAKIVNGQANAGQDLEADGQGRQALSASANEPEELAAVYPRHFAGHVSTVEADLQQIRGPHALAARQRALLRVHQ